MKQWEDLNNEKYTELSSTNSFISSENTKLWCEYCIHITPYSFMKLILFCVDAPWNSAKITKFNYKMKKEKKKGFHTSISDLHVAAPPGIALYNLWQM